MLEKFRKRFIGDSAFYHAVIVLIIPVLVQNCISNFVNLLDNLMVGALNDEAMSGVTIANQLIFVFNLCIFGGQAGPGIFGAQFYGAGDTEGLRCTFRIKVLLSVILVTVAVTVFTVFPKPLIGLYLRGDGDTARAEAMLGYSLSYLKIILLSLPAFALSQAYAGTLRETGETRLPMTASLASVFTNALFNYLLIFGKLGFKPLGVRGAAIATVIARYVELTIIMIGTHAKNERHAFIRGAYNLFRIPGGILKNVTRSGFPLLANEALWSFGMSTLTAVYSLCGLTVVSALSITSTISNLFNVFAFSMGTAVAIMIGQALGAKKYEYAKEIMWKLIGFAVRISLCTCTALLCTAGVLPKIYTGISEESQKMSSSLLRILACIMPLDAVVNCAYFTLRSGGKTGITFLFDCGFTWIVMIPAAFLAVKVFHADIYVAYISVNSTVLIKCVLGFLLLNKGVWVQNITD